MEIKIIFMKSDTTVVTGTSHHLQNGMEHSEYKVFHFYLHTISQNNFCKSCSKRYVTGFGSSDFSFYIKIPFTQKSLLLFQK